MESVLNKFKTRILVAKVSLNVQGGRRGRRRRCQRRGVEQETRTQGEGTGCCQGGRVRFAVELDVFGKGELCEDEVEMMMRWR